MPPALLRFERRFRQWVEENGMGWSRSTLRLPSGAHSSVTYRFTPRERSKRVLFALHGAGNDALFAWVGLFKRQLAAGSEIFTFDLPGHGRDSEGDFQPQLVPEALEVALGECVASCPDLPVHALGVSLGGSLLLAALPRIQHRLATAALVVAPLRIELSVGSVLAEIRPANFGMLWREREHYGLTGLIPSFGPFKRDIYPLRLPPPAAPGIFGYVETLNDGLEELRLEDAAGEVGIPVLLIYGDRDRVVPARQGQRLAGLIPNAHLLQLPRGTHLSTPLAPHTLDRVDRWLDRS